MASGSPNSGGEPELSLRFSAAGGGVLSRIALAQSVKIALAAAREISDCPQWRIPDRERECKSIMDPAATIAHMDVSVDTMVAHLAGALARP